MIQTSQQFKKARHTLDLSVRQCADLCNVNERTIRRWETGTGRGDGREPHPSACRLMELALEQAAPKLLKGLTS